jgi:hypothetical protein
MKTFFDGRKYYWRRYRNNKEVLKAYLAEYVEKNMEGMEFDAKSLKSFISEGDEQKLIEFLYKKLNLCLTATVIQQHNSIKELIRYCAYTTSVLRLKYERRKQKAVYENNPKLCKNSMNGGSMILNYIGYVPTDHYRFKYPSPIVRPFN